MATKHTQTYHTFGLSFEVAYEYTPGRPATPPAYSHGGLPPEDAEIEIDSIKLLDVDGFLSSIVVSPSELSTKEYDALHEFLFENHILDERDCDERAKL